MRHTFAPISDLKISIENCFLSDFFLISLPKTHLFQFVLDCIDADFCDQIRVGIGILFEKEVEKKGAWKTLEETVRELQIG